METIKLLERATGSKGEVAEDWMPASGGRPLVLDDPALIWLDYHGEQYDLERDPTEYSFFNFLCGKGVEFERKWVKEMAPNAIQLMERDTDVRKTEFFQKTLEALDRKEKVLTKAALMWAEEKIYGSADVIAHTCWLYKTFPQLKPETPEPDHYVILDLKMTSRLDSPAKADDLHIASNQVKIYSFILGHLQGYMPKRAFLITRDRIFDPLIVEVDQELNKPLSAELRSHRRQYTKIKLHGDKMRPWRATDTLVQPNFGNKKDAPWSGAKKEIEEERIPGRSLTMLPGIGPKLAEALMDKGYKSLDDLLAVKPETLPLEEVDGIGEILAKRIRAVLKANRSRKPTAVPSDIVPKKADIELFVDFETFNNLNIDFDKQWPNLEGTEMIFMIGVGYMEGRAWKQKNFVAASESHAAERKMLREFVDFCEERGVFSTEKSVAIYHWTSAEPTSAKQAAERHGIKRLGDLPFVDLYDTFANTPIGIPKCWDYSLKNVATAIGEYEPRFRIEWQDVASGSQAMVMGWAAYAQSKPLETLEMQRLHSYLKTDVKATWNALRWLRDAAKSQRTAMGWWSAHHDVIDRELVEQSQPVRYWGRTYS